MTRKFRVGIAGCGAGRTHLLEGYRPNSDLFDVVALCDLDEQRLSSVAEEFGIPTTTSNFDDLLDLDVDIIDICTPPALHERQILLALAANKNVICEKPLVGSLRALDVVAEAQSKSKGRVMPVFQYRYGNGVGKARAVIQTGIAGRLYAGSVETYWNRGSAYYQSPWRGRWDTELGGVLVGHAIHAHDLLTSLVGPVTKVFGRVATRVNSVEVDDCASASLEMADGGLVSLSATLGATDQITRLRLAFENLTIESDTAPYRPGEADWKIVGRTPDVERSIAQALEKWIFEPSRHTTQMRLLHHALVTGDRLPATLDDARRALELVTAIYMSSDSGCQVHLPLGSDLSHYSNWVPVSLSRVTT